MEGMVDAKGPQLNIMLNGASANWLTYPSQARRPLLCFVPRGKRADGWQEKGSEKNVSQLLPCLRGCALPAADVIWCSTWGSYALP